MTGVQTCALPISRKMLKKIGIDDVTVIDPNSWYYFNMKMSQAKAGRLAITLPDEPLEFINLILYLSTGKIFEITIFNTSGEKIEDEFLNDNYRTEAHEIKGAGSLHFVDPREDTQLNNLLENQKDNSYGPCNDYEIIDYIHRVMQFVNSGIKTVNNPTAICVSKFDLLMHRIPYDLPENPFVNIEEKLFIRKINSVSEELSKFLSQNSTTINPKELSSQFKNIRYFAVAPHGSDKYPTFWKDRNPKGILAPFLWILKELKILPE